MHLSIVFLLGVLATIVAGGPIEARQEVALATIIEEIVEYSNGVAFSTIFTTVTIETTISAVSTPTPTSIVATPVPMPASSSPSLTNPAATAAPTSDVLYPGWVEPQSQQFIDICVYHHNVHRANHSAIDVTYNSTLGSWAQTKADTCVFNEDPIPEADIGLGMNIAGGGYDASDPVNPSGMITMMWYNGEITNFPGYGNDTPDMTNFDTWGHFSQIVWPNSTEIGCGIQLCPMGSSSITSWFGVCVYSPQGNWWPEYSVISPPIGYPTVCANGDACLQ